MKKRNIFLILITFFISFTALFGCNKGSEYVPYCSVIFEYGVDSSGQLIKIDGYYRKAEFVKPGQLATRPSVRHEVYGEPLDWCTDETLTTSFNFNTPINQNTKVYAKWNQGDVKLTGVSFTDAGKAAFANELYAGDFTPLTKDYIWTTQPAGTTRYKNLKFTSSNEKVFVTKHIDLLDSDVVYATGAGTAILTVSATSTDEPYTTYSDSITVKVKANSNKVKSIIFTNPKSKTTETISMGEQETLDKQLSWKITGQDSTKEVINKNVFFNSSNDKVATVDQNGKVTFLYKGTATITIVAYNSNDGNLKYDYVTFNVDKTIHATDFELNAEKLDLFYKDSSYTDKQEFTLTATFTPPEASDQKIEWSLDKEGIISLTKQSDNSTKLAVLKNAPNNGSYDEVTITATHSETGGNTITRTCKVRLTLPIKSISFNTSTITLKPKETYTQTPTITSSATNKQITNLDDVKKIKWTSSNSDVATVDETTGLVTAVDGGETMIRATNTYDALTTQPYAEYKVIVESQLKQFYFDKEKLVMFYKDSTRTECPKSYQLNVTYVPDDATDKELTWSTNPKSSSYVTVNNEGLIATNNAPTTGEASDVTVIATHARLGNKTCAVHVVMPVETMSFDTSSHTMDIGNKYTQNVNLETSSGIAPSEECSGITWKSSDESIATVDANGEVTAISGGDVTITATNNYSLLKDNIPQASYKIHVNYELKDISLNSNYILFAEDFKTSETLTLTIDPSIGVDDFTITWTSESTSIATVTPSSDKLSATVKAGSSYGSTYIVVKVTDKYDNTMTMRCEVQNYDMTPTTSKLTFELTNNTYTVSSKTSTQHIVIPATYNSKNVTNVKDSGFAGTGITDVFIPYTITSIGANSFASCNSLSMVLFSISKTNNLTSIGEAAFKSNGFGALGYIGLENCKSLTTIGANAFENQVQLASISIPSSVTSIGSNAFNNCLLLSDITVDSDTIAKEDNPGALFTPSSFTNKVVKIKKGTTVGNVLGDATKYTKTTSSDYDIYTQI